MLQSEAGGESKKDYPKMALSPFNPSILENPSLYTIPKWHTLEAGQILTDTDAQRFRELVGPDQAGVFEVDPLLCSCGGAMVVVSFITDPKTIDHILQHLRRKGRYFQRIHRRLRHYFASARISACKD